MSKATPAMPTPQSTARRSSSVSNKAAAKKKSPRAATSLRLPATRGATTKNAAQNGQGSNGDAHGVFAGNAEPGYNSYHHFQNQSKEKTKAKEKTAKKPKVSQATTAYDGKGPKVPSWSVSDVCRWVAGLGFPMSVVDRFREMQIDGDLLLQMDDRHLHDDLAMVNGIHRKRFTRELSILKKDADYSGVDPERVAAFLERNAGAECKVYTYNLLKKDLSLSLMRRLSSPNLNDMLIEVGVISSIHRLKIVEAIVDDGLGQSDDLPIAAGSGSVTSGSVRLDSIVLGNGGSVHGEVFVSFDKRGNGGGAELASLIAMQLQLRGLLVHTADDGGGGGSGSSSAIRECKHFVVVLCDGSLRGCLGDGDARCSDPFHREVTAALESNANVIPVLDGDFRFPEAELLPADMRSLCFFNGVRWVHDYQEACVDKIERFITGESASPASRGGSLGRLTVGSRLRVSGDSGRSTPAVSRRAVAGRHRDSSSESGIFFQAKAQ